MPQKMARGGAHVGHLNSVSDPGKGNLTAEKKKKIKCPGVCPGEGGGGLDVTN